MDSISLSLLALFLWANSVHSMYYQMIPMSSYPSMMMNFDNGQPQQWNRAMEQHQPPQFAMLESNNRMIFHKPNDDNDDSLCQGGYVEYCLIQANQDGEQSMMAMASRTNRTTTAAGQDQEYAREFDGMCQIVLRFMNCINQHYFRCNPTSSLQKMNSDVFVQSWNNLCASDSQIRNKYLQHAKCIKHSLTHNNGQEQCQSLFQNYFLSSSKQFSLDSMENTVQYGCCAFNEWHYCIDTLIQRQCGSDATKAMQDLINQASAGLVSTLCERKIFGRKSRACVGKKNFNINKLSSLSPVMNETLQKYVTIFGEFIERLPDDDHDDDYYDRTVNGQTIENNDNVNIDRKQQP